MPRLEKRGRQSLLDPRNPDRLGETRQMATEARAIRFSDSQDRGRSSRPRQERLNYHYDYPVVKRYHNRFWSCFSRFESWPGSLRLGRSASEDGQNLGLEAAGHVNTALGVDEDVDLAPNAKLVQVDSWLDREAGPG